MPIRVCGVNLAPSCWLRPMTRGLILLGVLASRLSAQQPDASSYLGPNAHVVRNGRAADVGLRIGPAGQPRVSLGGLQDRPELEFTTTTGVLNGVLLQDGGVAVADGTVIRVYSREGRLVRSIGRAGSGPGEFRYVLDMCQLRNGAIVAVDQNLRRATVLSVAGDVLKEQPLPGTPLRDGCLESGYVLLRGSPAAASDRDRPRSDFLLISVMSGDTQSVGTLPAGRAGLFPRPHPIGAGGVVLVPGEAWFGVSVLRIDGTQAIQVRFQDPPVPVTDADRNRELDSRLPTDLDQKTRESIRTRLRKNVPTVGSWPPVERLLADRERAVWLAVPRLGSKVRQWLIVDLPSGRPLGWFQEQWPVGGVYGEILDVRDRELLAAYRDEDGATHVIVQEIPQK